MTFRLTVDGQRWTSQLSRTAAGLPGLVPLITGHGFGFGAARLAQRATAIGARTVAVDAAHEVDGIRPYFAGSILVRAPLLPSERDQPPCHGVLRTVASAAVVEALAAEGSTIPIVLQLALGGRQAGIAPSCVPGLIPALQRLRLGGLAMVLPVGGDRQHLMAEIVNTLSRLRGAGLEPGVLWLSQPDGAVHQAVAGLQRQLPWLTLRVTIGADLWMGDGSSFAVTGAVLDRHPIAGRGTVIDVSGGADHGLNMNMVAGQHLWLRRRLLRESPFEWQGRRLRYAGTLHARISSLVVPAGVEPPAIGDRLACDVPVTSARFDEVELLDAPAVAA